MADGRGGAIVAWVNVLPGSVGIFSQRMGANGQRLWTPGGGDPGKLVSTSATSTQGPMICPDDSGGVYVTWAPTSSALAQHLDSLGTRWTFFPPAVQGVTLRSTGSSVPRGVVPDGAGGAIVAMSATSGSNGVVCLQRINAARSVLWGPNGVDVCVAPSAVINALIPDGAGGAIVAWEDRRNGTSNPDIFVQRISSAGSPQWTANGVPVCTATNFQTTPLLRLVAGGDVIVVWKDQRDTPALALFAQRLDGAGVTQWMPDGVPVAAGLGVQERVSVVPAAGDSTFVVWNSTATGGGDVFAQKLDESGTRMFGPAGIAFCRGQNNQTESNALADGLGGVYAAFRDTRNGDGDIYAQHLGADGAAGPGVLAVPVLRGGKPLRFSCWPSPWRAQLRISLERVTAEGTRVEIFDVAGRRRWRAFLEPGAASLIWNGRDDRGAPLESGVYRVRLTRGDEAGVATVVHVE